MKRTFTIPGKPCGKGRPRFARMGKFVKTYTPKETASYENLVKLCYLGAHGKAMFPAGVPLRVNINAHFPIPKSWSKKLRLAAVYHTGRIDADNIGKLIGDALNGIAYHDDAQVAVLHVAKWMTFDEPRVEVVIEGLET